MKGKPPFLLGLRSSTAFITLTVGLGVMTDLAGYGLIVPVVPFRLAALGYDEIGSKTGWLVTAYAAGLIVSSPPIAWLGAKFRSRRTPLILGILFMMGGIILFMETASFAAMVVSRILQGISGTALWTLGLSLIVDSVPEERVGQVMGQVMIGFSVGTVIGPPVGGVLYERMGYRAPFVFALCLLFVDLVLRMVLIEKHVALKWVRSGVDVPGFEAPGYVAPTSPAAPSIPLDSNAPPSKAQKKEEEENKPVPSQLSALLSMMVNPRAMTAFVLTLFYGIVLGGTLDTALTLWLEHQYGLNSLGAGLVFLGAVVPSFVASPLAGWGSDKIGAKLIAVGGIILSIPAYSLLIIPGPLPLFIFFLVLFGFSMSMFLTPVTHDLSIVVSQTPGLPATAAYGMFNMAFSLGAFIGPIIAGQVINALEIRRGWILLCALSSGLSAVLLPPAIVWLGGPLKRGKKDEVTTEEAAVEA
ncbi:MFS multidrug transporter [Pseudohyphozyma bogoriensis]|nr:MFS multidrug transporter [Pseudohyphozyma bogoriensis]